MKQITIDPKEYRDPLLDLESKLMVSSLRRLQSVHPSKFAGNDLKKRYPPPGKEKGPLALFNDVEAAHAKAIKAVEEFWSEVEGQEVENGWFEKHYTLCRQVAGYHQLIEILEQGMGAFWAAAEDGVLIFQGNGCVASAQIFCGPVLTAMNAVTSISKGVFKKLYPKLSGAKGVLPMLI